VFPESLSGEPSHMYSVQDSFTTDVMFAPPASLSQLCRVDAPRLLVVIITRKLDRRALRRAHSSILRVLVF